MNGRQSLANYIGRETTQAKFAREIQCSESHLSLFLSGERDLSVSLAKKISAASGIAAGDLLGLHDKAAE